MRAYCPSPLESQPIHSSFLFRASPGQILGGLFKENLPQNFFENNVTYTETPEEADVVVLSNNFVSANEEVVAHIKKYADIAEQTGKQMYIFSCGDLTDTLQFDPRVKVFKYSMYRSKIVPQEICTPTLTEDIGRTGVILRQKNTLPVVSFCGKGGFASQRERFAAIIRRIGFEIVGIFMPIQRARIRGVFWRMWAIKACSRSPLVASNFIIRKTFSGAARTIEVPPEQARKDFIDNIVTSDFVLAPKGDGNYSNRFLEALSVGRIPVLVDTDSVLPLEHLINYSKIVVRVPMNQVRNTPKFIRKFYDELSYDDWKHRQQLARDVFENYLRQDAFFAQVFRASGISV